MTIECGGSSVALALTMASYFMQAVTDHPEASGAVLYLRFLGWLR